ncbi:MAG: hypothetical protein AAFZ01_01275 [Pseudomonadota bacterium]
MPSSPSISARRTDPADVLPATPRLTHDDLKTVAVLLESRHGTHAQGMAEFFSNVHAQLGDAEKCWAWGGVAMIVADRERARTKSLPTRACRSRSADPTVRKS